MTVRFTTYNLLDLFGAETAEARQHYETIAGVIRTLDADVLSRPGDPGAGRGHGRRAAPHARGRRWACSVRYPARPVPSVPLVPPVPPVPKPRSRSAGTATTSG